MNALDAALLADAAADVSLVDTSSTTLDGVLTLIRFHRDGYLIGEVRQANGVHVGVKGPCTVPQIGAQYQLQGEWTSSKYGRTFAFKSYTVELPRTSGGIVEYLMGAAKWIGPAVGEALVAAYGDDTLQVLKADPERVAGDINGITLPRAREIQALLVENEQMEAVTVGLNALIIGTGMAGATVRKAIEKWKHQALDIVRQDPFKMCDLPGVGFVMADRVRANLGIPSDAPSRIAAGIEHALTEAAHGDGHTYLPDGHFRRVVGELLNLPQASYEGALPEIEAIHLTRVDLWGLAGYDVALRKYWKAERQIADQLLAMLELPFEPKVDEPSEELAKYLCTLAPDQQEALSKMQRSRVFVLTGAPGTGKTHLVKAMLLALEGKRIALAAPTGKAAKRLMEQTGAMASTIHRLLEPRPEPPRGDGQKRFSFSRNRSNPLPFDVVVLDECSMIDVSLMASFLDALPLETRLILIGDTHQLPSVGPGNVLRDVIGSNRIPMAELTTIKRQDAGLIIRNCHAIKNGHAITISNEAGGDFFWDECHETADVFATVVDLVSNRIPTLGMDPVRDIQVIAPLREKGDLSCKALNERLQAALNRNSPPPNQRFAVGDKVIQTRNDYSLGIFNGDIGIVQNIDIRAQGSSDRAQTIEVVFDAPERRVVIPLKSHDLELAYAITCHKFQGSEARAIVIPIHRTQGPLILQRSWLYTAISRAQEVCVCVGQSGEVRNIVKRQGQARRYTHLEGFLRAGIAR